MKKLIVFTCLLSLLFSLNACSSYYYSMLSSDKGIVGVNEYNDFVQENDSVRIIYNFYGEDAPVRITVFNKLDEPMYIDWQRSSLIIGDKAVSYYKEVMPVQGDPILLLPGNMDRSAVILAVLLSGKCKCRKE